MKAASQAANHVVAFDHKRDTYGFAVRPQHVQRYREYANIYKEEEEERSERWKSFLDRQSESAQLLVNDLSVENDKKASHVEVVKEELDSSIEEGTKGEDPNSHDSDFDSSNIAQNANGLKNEDVLSAKGTKSHKIQIWTEIRPSLRAIEDMMSVRVKKKKDLSNNNHDTGTRKLFSAIEESKSPRGVSEEDSEDEFYDVEKSDPAQEAPSSDSVNSHVVGIPAFLLPVESSFPWTEELEVLVRGGVPMAIRGELWQAFVGVRARRVENYYTDLLASETISENNVENPSLQSDSCSNGSSADSVCITEKWKGQIEKDLPRTFPGHPWLDTPEGHAALRRVLVGYSFRDSDVGYCQGLNYVAALLLLVMKTEEDAFWMLAVLLENVLVSDCYTTNLSGCHVEQRVFKDLLTKKCPRIAAHLEALDFDVSLVATEWFLCLFSKSLPSETTLRVWDVLFYEGAKVLFHVALAIFKMKEGELLITHHVGDVINILQKTTHYLFDPDDLLTVAYDKIGSMTTNTISKQRKKQEPAVMAELDQRLRRLNSLKADDK